MAVLVQEAQSAGQMPRDKAEFGIGLGAAP